MIPWLVLTTALAGSVWDLEPMTASPQVMLDEAATAFGPDEGGTLWRHVTVDIGADGRTHRSTHEVMRIADPEHLPPIAWGYAPWHQETPIIRARVIQADGTVTDIDRATEVEQVIGDSGNRILTDTRILQYDLPRVDAGALIEWTIEEQQHRPFLGEAASGRERVGGSLGRLYAGRFEVHAPKALPLSWQLNEVDGRTRVRVKKGIRQVVLDVEQVLPVNRTMAEARWVDDPRRWLEYSTFSSWGEVREAYAGLVDPLYDPEGATALLQPKPSGERLDRIRTHLDAVNDAIRYTGIEFGHQSIVPYSPKTVCDRGFGDCKDQATLLASLLRHDGIDAYVALLQAGFEAEDPKPLANPTHFNHAIVYVPAADGAEALWLDPTSPVAAVGSLPVSDQHRYALVVGPGFDELLQTPTTEARTTYTLRYDMRNPQPTSLAVSVTHDGWAADFDRWGLRESQGPPEPVVAERAKRAWRKEEVAGVVVSGLHRHSGPLSLRYRFDDWRYRSSSDSFPARYRMTFAELDRNNTLEAASYSASTVPKSAAIRIDPIDLTHRLEIIAGPGFGLLPASSDAVPVVTSESFGPVRLERSVEPIEEGWAQVTRLRVTEGRIRMGDLSDLMERLESLEAPEVGFGARHDHKPGDPVLRLQTAGNAVAAHPDDPDTLENWTSLLSSMFYPDEALRLLDDAAERGILTPGLDRVRAAAIQSPRIGTDEPPVDIDGLMAMPLGDLEQPMAWNAAMRRLATVTQAVPPFTADPDLGAAMVGAADALHGDRPLLIGLRDRLRRQLLNLGRYDAITTEPKEPRDTWVPYRQDSVWLAATALSSGISEAVDALDSDAEAWNTAHDAAVILSRLRKPDEARAILEAARGGAPDALDARAMIDEFANLSPWSEHFDAAGPMGALARGLEAHQGRMLRREPLPQPGTRAAEQRRVLDSAVLLHGADDIPIDAALDWVVAQTSVTVDTLGELKQVRAKGVGRRPVVTWLRGEGASMSIFATSAQPSPLGAHALQLLDAGDLDAATAVLEWAGQARGDNVDAFRTAWKNADRTNPTDLRALAALLAAVSGVPEDFARLHSEGEGASDAIQIAIGDTLVGGWLFRGQLDRALDAAESWPHSGSDETIRARLDVLRENGRYEEANALLDGWSKTGHVVRYERSMILLAQGKVDKAIAPHLADYQATKRTSSLVTVVRILTAAGRHEEAAQRARTVLEEPILIDDHYLAAALALVQVGDWTGVHDALSRTRSENTELSRDWWYVIARIAEAAGLDALAARCDAGVPQEPWRAMSASKLQAAAK